MPFVATDFGLPEHAPCPFCDGRRTELHSPFGPQLSVASYWCFDCHTAFDWLKWSAQPASAARETPRSGADRKSGSTGREPRRGH